MKKTIILFALFTLVTVNVALADGLTNLKAFTAFLEEYEKQGGFDQLRQNYEENRQQRVQLEQKKEELKRAEEAIEHEKYIRVRTEAEGGNSDAQVKLAAIYALGAYNVEQDYSEATTWLLEAARQGNVQAEYNLGVLYYQGTGVSQDYNEALKWFMEAANQGHSDAQNNVGWMYRRGLGVKRDCIEADKWFQKAADQGNARAKHNLGASFLQKALEGDYRIIFKNN